MEGHVVAFVLDGVVHEVENDVREVHFVDEDVRLVGPQVGSDGSACAFHFEAEGVDHAGEEVVCVDLTALEGGFLAVEHRHLQHLLHLEAQPLRLVVDDARNVVEHGLALAHGGVSQHLCGQRDGGDGRLELVGHVVDEVVLDLRQPFLAERDIDGVDERQEQDERENDGRYDEPDAGEQVLVHLGKVDDHHAHLRGRRVGKEQLGVGIVGPAFLVVRTAVNLAAVAREDAEVVGQFDAVGQELRPYGLVELLEVDSFLQRLVAGPAEQGADHLVDQCALVLVASADFRLKGFRGVAERVFPSRVKSLRLGRGVGLERVHPEGRVVMADAHRVGHTAEIQLAGVGILRAGGGFADFVFQSLPRFVEFEAARGLVQASADRLVELLLPHAEHLFEVAHLKVEQREKRQPHDNGNNPDGRLFHTGKDKEDCGVNPPRPQKLFNNGHELTKRAGLVAETATNGDASAEESAGRRVRPGEMGRC